MGNDYIESRMDVLRKKAEKRLLKDPGQMLDHLGKTADELIQELSVSAVHVEMQREKLRRQQERIEELQARLEEAEQTVNAIHTGQVDAILVSGNNGNKIYTLEGADFTYRNIVETMNSGAVTLDAAGTILYSNNLFSQMSGLPLDRLMGSFFKDLVLPSHQSAFLKFLKRTHEVRKATAEMAIGGREGGLFVHLSASSLTSGAEEQTSLVITDISERKRVEESLQKAHDELREEIGERRKTDQAFKENEQRYRRLVETANEGIWSIGPEGQTTFVNTKMAEMLGYRPKEMLGKDYLQFVLEEDALREREHMEQIRSTGAGRHHNSRFRKKNGEVLSFRVSVSPATDDHGNYIGFLAMLTDITDQLRLEEQLRQSQKMEAIGTLAGGIAHDFNNILAVIIGNAELALDDLSEGEDPRRSIEQIFAASQRARDLVKQILTFSRKSEYERKPLSLTPLLKETYKLLRSSLPSTIKMVLDIRTEEDIVLADPSQMQQVLMNLCTNGAHAMREKGGTLTIRLSDLGVISGADAPDRDMLPGRYVELAVTDTGTGMTADVRKRIFEPFFTTKETGQGTGMGLAVVYGIVKNHNGMIAVESAPRRGSSFRVFLPEAPVGEPAEREGTARIPTGNERILFVDDEAILAEMTQAMLERLGYDVTIATRGSDAWNLFREDVSRFDLVITDQTMPDVTGLSLAERMLELRKDIPIILCTGYSETVSPERTREAGIREFVMKPLVKKELAEAVRRVLDNRPS